MSRKTLAFAAITALALSAHAQTYNWELTTSGSQSPGNGSGQLTLTGDVVTAMSGTVAGKTVSLLNPDDFMGNNNKLPIDSSGVSFAVSGVGDFNLYLYRGNLRWGSPEDYGPATFTYTAVPEPSTWAMGGVFGMAAVMTAAARRRRAATQA